MIPATSKSEVAIKPFYQISENTVTAKRTLVFYLGGYSYLFRVNAVYVKNVSIFGYIPQRKARTEGGVCQWDLQVCTNAKDNTKVTPTVYSLEQAMTRMDRVCIVPLKNDSSFPRVNF